MERASRSGGKRQFIVNMNSLICSGKEQGTKADIQMNRVQVYIFLQSTSKQCSHSTYSLGT